MAVIADAGRGRRVEGDELVEERGEGGGEVGHGPESSGRETARVAVGYHAPMSAQTWVTPVTLTGQRVRLEPLREDHYDDLARVAFDAPVWRWTIAREQTEAGLRDWLAQAVANAAAGTEVPFATVDLASGRAIGSSRFMTIAPEHRRLEIGWTWVGTAFQRTGANREAKLLQLTHAFETLDAERVEFKTHARNLASRAALLGIGATFEGVLRHHTIMPDGSHRDSAFYGIIASEWPAGPRPPAGQARPMTGGRAPITTTDYHTGGEPFRIVTGGVPDLGGATVLERRRWAAEHADHVRQMLVNEPRGHADMYGGFVTPPDDDGADLGVVFFHNEGYSTACGHGTIALVTWAIDSGRVAIAPATPGTPGARDVAVTVDVPSGRLACTARLDRRRPGQRRPLPERAVVRPGTRRACGLAVGR